MKKDILLNKLSSYKNLIFLLMCTGVHIINTIFFGVLGLLPLMLLNLVSSIFYLCMIALYQKESDKEIVLIYIEIILFSSLSDLLIGGIYDYIFFTIGMVSVITYLLSDNFKHKHALQGFGALIAILIFFARLRNVCFSPETAINAFHYQIFFKIYNLCVTIFTLIYVSGLYTIELSTTKEKLKYTSNHDTLTGLYNRRFFEQALSRSVHENTSIYSIAMFDIDNFKKVNDTYGHDSGDKVLETVSKCLESHLTGDELAIRWGGEEFILYMPLISIEQALEKVNKICDEIRNTEIHLKDCSIIKVTATVGLQSGSDLTKYESVINEADDRLYRGKSMGKNCIVSS